MVRSICDVPQCGKPAVSHGLCNMHRMRYAKHGDVNASGRPDGWGKGHGDPLYERWRSMRRTARLSGGYIQEWESFQAFKRDVGELPGPNHRLYRRDKKKPYGPENVTWREPQQETPAGKTREERNAYMREWTRKRPHIQKAQYLRRHYGVTLEWYEGALEAQGGVCAICRREEQRRHRSTGEVMFLAVDHDHRTGAVRGLLCSFCNHALGNLDDDITRLRAAIAYLERHGVSEEAI